VALSTASTGPASASTVERCVTAPPGLSGMSGRAGEPSLAGGAQIAVELVAGEQIALAAPS
jgi:hypothetical protein